MPLLPPPLLDRELATANRQLQMIRSFTVAFFDEPLKEQWESLGTIARSTYPEVMFEAFSLP